MISSNDLCVYLIQHNQNKICDQNLRSIQDVMRSEETSGRKFKPVCTDFPNMVVLTKSATSGGIQVSYVHAFVGNKSLGKTITAFALAGSSEAPTVVSIDTERAFSGNGKNIQLLTTEVLLRTAAGDLAK